MARLLAITGGSGYIGRKLVWRAMEAGWRVITLGRGAPPFPDLFHLHFDLESPALPVFPECPDALIHLACGTTGVATERDVQAAWVLANGLKDSGGRIRLVFVSSQTASHSAPTAYGRAKAAVEDILRPIGAIVVRPGLVFGGPQAGLWGDMSRLVARVPVLPALAPAPLVQPIHLDDLCSALLAIAAGVGRPGQIMNVAAPEPITITHFLRMLAAHRRRRHVPIFIPVPNRLLLLASRAAAALLPGLRPRARQLASMAQLPLLASAADLLELGISPRSLLRGIGGKCAVRRALLAEAAALMQHVTGVRPSPHVLRRYVRDCEQLGLEAIPELPGSLKLRLVTPSLAAESFPALGLPLALKWRFQFALGMADSMPSTAPLFYLTKPRSALLAGLELVLVVFGELPFLIWRLLRRTGREAFR
jgi:nucleoside-diphosphate-sugar epimerase